MANIQIININDPGKSTERNEGKNYQAKHYELGYQMGSEKIGYNLTEIPPGKKAFPYHFHYINEELFLITEGEGTLRSPLGERRIKKGDLILCPTGPEGVHQILNTGKEPLKYLAFSSLETPEIVEYPDSQKFGASLRPPRRDKTKDFVFRILGFKKDAKDYWDGEET